MTIRLLFLFLLWNTCFAHIVRRYPDAPLKIITVGHPTLYLIAQHVEELEIKSKKFQKLIDDMILTMKDAGGVGVAAPQVNVSKRLFVIKPKMFKKAEIFINPVLEYLEDKGKKISLEGCLSIPGKEFKVERYKELHVSYQNRSGEYVKERASGFRAIVIQHEYDHLNGTLISDIFTEAFSVSDDFEFTAPLM